MTKVSSYKSPWANLAAAIIRSGERENDQVFLDSDWCDTLKRLCALDDEETGKKFNMVNIGPSAKFNPGD